MCTAWRLSYPDQVDELASVGPAARSYRWVSENGYSTGGPSCRVRLIVDAVNDEGGTSAVARWANQRIWVP